MPDTVQQAPTDSVDVTVLGSGSSGNALVIRAGGRGILVDAGFSAKELRRRLTLAGIDETCLDAVIVTHEHEDHISALRVFAKPLELPVYATRLTAEAMKYAKKAPERLAIFTAGASFTIGNFGVEPFSIPHDASDPVGFTIRWGARKIGVVTDLGHANAVVCDRLRECDLLVVESNHDLQMLRNSARPWNLKHRIAGKHGHLSNDDCMKLLQTILHARTRHLVLAHASCECNRYELIEQLAIKVLAAMGRHDLKPHVARQTEALPRLVV